MATMITSRGADLKTWILTDHHTKLIAKILDQTLLPKLLPHLHQLQSCSKEKMMLILLSYWTTQKGCTNLLMNVEENILILFRMQPYFTSRSYKGEFKRIYPDNLLLKILYGQKARL